MNMDDIFFSQNDDKPDFVPIISADEDSELRFDDKNALPILPLRNTVLFPGVIIPITVGREKSNKLIRDVYAGDRLLGTFAQKDMSIEDPSFDDLHQTGTIAQVVKILNMPDNTTSVIIQGKKRINLQHIDSYDPYLIGKVQLRPDPIIESREFDAIVSSIKDQALKIVEMNENMPQEAAFAIKNIEKPDFLVNYITSNSNLKTEDKQALLETDSVYERSLKLLEHLTQEIQMLNLKMDIESKVKTELDKQQKEYLLNQQMKTIQDELGGDPSQQEAEELKNRSKKKKWPKEIQESFKKELKKLRRINPATPEYSVQVNYLNVMLDLPWEETTKDNFDLHRAQEILDNDHYGLEKVKERIIEHLAVLKLKGDLKSPILCLYGPPGVGKTSLGKSIAEALNRKYVRMSLGGLHDESEIRGHRKTYIGAMPGRILQNMRKAKASNPVFILDEIDKLGRDVHGDPESALLEVLDPEQNSTFHDNFLELDYDLSKVLFVATANTIGNIHPALRDRMEMIEVSGYLLEEKVEIAKRHLIPQQLENHGLKPSQLKFPDEVLSHIIENYTRESGVRALNKKIAQVMRRVARKIATDDKYNISIKLTDIREYLGVQDFFKTIYQGNEHAGVVTGLAWTAAGGEILFIESSLSKGKGNFTITGNLGDVMKESAKIAVEYLRAHTEMFGLESEVFDKWNIHIHIPEGAIPKDGPSAGITMVVSLASAFTQRKVKKGLAMTGEITLRGKVLPVGGIKEKILAAKRAGLKEIILSEMNKKDLEEIKPIYLKGLKFHFVDTIADVLDIALTKQKVANPLKLN
ncbi:MAG: endopeptidase La [Salinivirgaceae bacterium]|nr:MAG: endopeptidase La [Salinivirgaceae bacterium]